MRVCYFGIYDPEYARNRVLIKGLRQNGVEVILCCDRSPSFIKYWRLFVRHARLRNRYDVMVVGFPAQAAMPLARLISSRPVVMDAFVSLYEMNVGDRAVHSPRSLCAFWYWLLDWFSCRLAHTVLVDTDAHGDYFAATFAVPRRKLRRVLAGAETDNATVSAGSAERNGFMVHWHGSHIPLHGIECVLRAASLVADDAVRWEIIGLKKIPLHAGRVAFFKHMPFYELMERVKESDLCLGIFGTTAKAGRVIPNKIYECLAKGKPVITADTKAVREVFGDEELYLIPSANPVLLAFAVARLKRDTGLRTSLAENGRRKFLACATPAILGSELKTILESTLS